MPTPSKQSRLRKNAFASFNARHAPAIDRFLDRFFTGKRAAADFTFIADSFASLREYCLRPGKRVRPLVLIAAYLGYGGARRGLRDVTAIAASLELMHSFLLIQDDVIDRAVVRRGGAALHVLMDKRHRRRVNNANVGTDVALVLGDVLFSNALEIIAGARVDGDVKNEFMKVFARTYEFTAWGQVLDILHSLTREIRPAERVSMNISLLKTAYYTVCNPLLMGHVLAGKTGGESEATRIARFALPLGLAFQLRDDILGVFGKREKTGKPSDSDLAEGKLTMLVETAVERLGVAERKRFVARFTEPRKTAADIAYLRGVLTRTGVRETAEAAMHALAEESREHLAKLAIGRVGRDVFSSLVDEIVRL